MSNFLIKKLDWESDFFGYEIAKIEIFNSSNIEQIPKIISQSPFLLVQLFSKIDLSNFLKLNPIDIKLIYSKKLLESRSLKNVFIKSANEDLDGSLARLAKEAGKNILDLKKDKILNLKFEKMYELWMNKSLKRELASEVLIHQNEKINGMITVKKNDEAIISLISVKSDMKNKGIENYIF